MLAKDAETLLRVARKYGFILVNNNEAQAQGNISNEVVSELTRQNETSEFDAKEIARFFNEFAYQRNDWEGILNLKSSSKKTLFENKSVVLTQHENGSASGHGKTIL